MATVYSVEVVSYWVSYSKEDLEKMLREAVKRIEVDNCNQIEIRVK